MWTLSTEAEIGLPDNVSKGIFPIKRYVTIKTPVPEESPLPKHGDFIVLLNNDLETSHDASKEPLHPHDASDLEKKTAKYHNKDWLPAYIISPVLLII